MNKLIKIILIIYGIVFFSCQKEKDQVISFSHHIGVPCQIKIYTKKQDFSDLFSQLKKKLDFYKLIFSDYEDNSEIKILTNNYILNKKYKISQDLFNVLAFSKKMFSLSEGLFDVSISHFSIQWRIAKFVKKPPEQRKLQRLKEKNISSKDFILNDKDKTIIFLKKNIRFDLGAIAKGYILDQMKIFLKKQGFRHFFIDIGGDISFSKAPTYKKNWLIKIDLPHNKGFFIKLKEDGNIAKSGDDKRGFKYKKTVYSHIINPLTGNALTNKKQVCVIGKSAMITDSLATTFSLMPIKKVKKLHSRYFPAYDYYISDSNSLIFMTKNFKNLIKKP